MGSFIPLLAERTYTDKLSGLAPAAWWPMNESSGTTADNAAGNASYDGTYSNVTVGQAGILPASKAATFNGTTSYLNLLSAAAAVNGAAGTVAFWAKPASTGVWTDATNRRFFTIFVNASNFIYLQRWGTTDYSLLGGYAAGGVSKTIGSVAPGGRSGWVHIAMTWSKASDRLRLYVDGVMCGQVQTGLGVWAGTPTIFTVGAGSVTPTSVWNGSIAMFGLWTSELTEAQILSLSRKTPGLPAAGQRKAIHYLGRSSGGVFDPTGTYALGAYRDANGVWQLLKTPLDNSPTTILTDPAPVGGPAATLHKAWTAFHPTADWCAVQVEIAGHPWWQSLTQPVRGISNDIWRFKPSTNGSWANLTNYGTGAAVGVLNPAFSLDGTQLIWGEKYAGADANHAYGYWRICVAGFNPTTGALDFAGRQTFEPEGTGWYEPHGEVSAGNILFSHDKDGTRPYATDMGIFNTTSGLTVTDVSDDADHWDEHGATNWDGSGDYIYCTTRMYGPVAPAAIEGGDYATLKGDGVYVTAGGQETRLTFFNHPDYPEYSGEPCFTIFADIESGGGRIAATRHQEGASYDTANWHHQYIVHRQT